jgi:hypothetical protein
MLYNILSVIADKHLCKIFVMLFPRECYLCHGRLLSTVTEEIGFDSGKQILITVTGSSFPLAAKEFLICALLLASKEVFYRI